MTMKKTPSLKIEQRQRLYYRQYCYAIELDYNGFEYMNRVEPESVANEYHRRRSYTWRTSDQHLHKLEELVLVASELQKVEQKYEGNFKVTNSWHTRFYYTNSDLLIYSLHRVPEIAVTDYREAVASQPDGVVLRKNNPYQYRTYFRERKIDPARGVEFLEAVVKYGDYFSMNDTTRLRLAMKRHHYPFSRHSYIDHHSEHDRVMLEMMLPGYLGRTLPIQAK
jgi:hypothetical protein